jgi:hypothetical protein
MPFDTHLKRALLKRGGDFSENNNAVLFRKGEEIISFQGSGKSLPHEEIIVTHNGNPLNLLQWLSPNTPVLRTGAKIVQNVHGTNVACIDICDNILENLGFLESGGHKKYGRRKVIDKKETGIQQSSYVIPENFQVLIEHIKRLKEDHEHKERAHESLVQDYYELMGYSKFEEIKFQIGRIDVCIKVNNKPAIVTEVKRDWKLSKSHAEVVEQAYNYANEVGATLIVITNGNYYAIYNRQNGFSYDENFIGEFTLTEITEDKLNLMRLLSKDNLPSMLGALL